MRLDVFRHREPLAVCQLAADAPVPGWATSPGGLRAAVRSSGELSLVCADDAVPDDVRREGPFTAFEVDGPLDLALTGVIAALLAPLAAAGVSVFTISTFNTDWILVPDAQTLAAVTALTRAGHTIIDTAASDGSAGEDAP